MHIWRPGERGSRASPGRIDGGNRLRTRRVLIALTLVLLLTVSIGVGVLVADWPHLRQVLFP
jgi:hypothetical protein